jgi:DNA-binding beta-propeller fold protein YncE
MMDFSQAEAEFERLKGQFEASDLTEDEFKAELQELMIEDEQGRWWTIGFDTGHWYCYDGEQWLRSEPPAVEPAPVGVDQPAEAREPVPQVGRFVRLGRLAWWPLLLIVAGWGLNFWIVAEVDFWILNFPHPSLALTWFLAGLATGVAMKWSEPAIRWEHVLIMASVWGIGGLLLFSGESDEPLPPAAIGFCFIWGGGLASGLALRLAGLTVRWSHVFAVTLTWIIAITAGVILPTVLLIPDSWPRVGWYPGDPFLSALVGFLVGAVGGGMVLWQIGRARARMPPQFVKGRLEVPRRIPVLGGIPLSWIGGGFVVLALLLITAVALIRQGEVSGRTVPEAELVAELHGHTGPVNGAMFSPDGEWVVTASDDQTARVWEASTGRSLVELRGHTGPVNRAMFSPDGKWVVTASDDGTARVWELSTGSSLAELRGHTGPVNDTAFSPDGEWVVTASDDGTARVWEAGTGRSLVELRSRADALFNAAFSPDGTWVVASTRDLSLVWEASSGSLVATLMNEMPTGPDGQFTPDGSQVLTVGNWDGVWRLWSIPGGLGWGGDVGDVPTSAALSPDGEFVAVAGVNFFTLQVWEASPRHKLTAMRGHTSPIRSVAFSPDSQYVVTSDWYDARVWETATGRSVAVLGGRSALFSPDGQRLVTIGGDNIVRVWSVQVWTE